MIITKRLLLPGSCSQQGSALLLLAFGAGSMVVNSNPFGLTITASIALTAMSLTFLVPTGS